MTLPWQSYMVGRAQDREIRKFMDQLHSQSVAAAYGGMSFDTDTPTTINLTATAQKLTVFNSKEPINAEPVLLSFDQPNSNLDFLPNSTGVYRMTFEVVAGVRQNRQYFFELRDNDVALGPEFQIGVVGSTTSIEMSPSAYVYVPAGSKISIWVRSDAAATFDPFSVAIIGNRISPQLP